MSKVAAFGAALTIFEALNLVTRGRQRQDVKLAGQIFMLGMILFAGGTVTDWVVSEAEVRTAKVGPMITEAIEGMVPTTPTTTTTP